VRAVVFSGAGGNEVVRLEERPDPLAGKFEVVVAATHAGVNPADVLQRQGRHAPSPGSPEDIPGLEVAGIVVSCGDSATRWREGDRVFGLLGGGGLADSVAVHERHLAPVPAGLDDRSAAGVPEASITAHDAIVTQAGLGPGDVLLVNGANGAVGISAIQIGHALGARVFANARHDHLRERIAALGAEPVAPENTVERVRDAGGADVVLELVGAPNLAGDLDTLAPKGRIVVVGTAAGAEAPLSLGKLMGRRASVRGTLLRARSLEEKAVAVRAWEHAVVPLYGDGRATMPIDRVFPAAEAADAFDYLGRPGKFGKVLLEFE
jgi:NADPH2:quinone reductase